MKVRIELNLDLTEDEIKALKAYNGSSTLKDIQTTCKSLLKADLETIYHDYISNLEDYNG